MQTQDLRYLTAEERALYGAWLELFSSPGFKLMLKRAEEEYGEAGELYDKVGNDVGFARIQGFRNALKLHVLNLQTVVENGYDALVVERKAIQAESLEDEVDA